MQSSVWDISTRIATLFLRPKMTRPVGTVRQGYCFLWNIAYKYAGKGTFLCMTLSLPDGTDFRA